MPIRKKAPAEAAARPSDGALNVNQVVGANLRRAREAAGMTQGQLADQLNEMTGSTYTKTSISAMERSAEGGKRRVFDVQQVLEFSRLFALPMFWFLIPTQDQLDAKLDLVGDEHGYNLLEFVFGTSEAERQLRQRLTEAREHDPDKAATAAVRFAGAVSQEAATTYTKLRAAAIDTLLTEETHELEAALDDLHGKMIEVKHLLNDARKPSAANPTDG